MTRVQKITLKAVEAIAEKLKTLPEQKPEERQIGKQEAIAVLKNEIEAVRRRGYSFEQIAEYLKGGGLDIGSAALKSYLARAKAPSKANKVASKTKSKATTQGDPGRTQETSMETRIETGHGGFDVKSDRNEI